MHIFGFDQALYGCKPRVLKTTRKKIQTEQIHHDLVLGLHFYPTNISEWQPHRLGLLNRLGSQTFDPDRAFFCILGHMLRLSTPRSQPSNNTLANTQKSLHTPMMERFQNFKTALDSSTAEFDCSSHVLGDHTRRLQSLDISEPRKRRRVTTNTYSTIPMNHIRTPQPSFIAKQVTPPQRTSVKASQSSSVCNHNDLNGKIRRTSC